MFRPRRSGGVAVLAVLLGVLISAGDAGAYVYWTKADTPHPESIGRVNNNGTHVDAKFIADAKSFPDAVTTDRRHVYWISGLYSIGRARIDGTHVEPKFIDHIDGYLDDLVAGGGYIYWTNGHDESIGRARANGTGVDAQFIPLEDPQHVLRFTTPTELAIAGGYLYWANAYQRYAIGRARLDGTELDREFIYVPRGDPYTESLHNPYGLAANKDYVYWTDRGTRSIGRATTDGTDINVEFIPDVGKYVSSLALDDDYLYWPGEGNSLMRSNLDGSRVKAFVRHVAAVTIFVDRLGP